MTEFTTSHAATPVVSFLTVNYYQPKVTLALLRSLEDLNYSDWECIVVNNGKADEQLQQSCEAYAKVRYLESGDNLGFAGGNNLGLPLCRGRYIFFINNDTEVEPNLLPPILKVFEEYNHVGMLSPKIVFDHDRQTIQYAGSTDLSKITLRNQSLGFGELDKGQYDEVRETAFVHGAAMIVPREVIDKIGPMREDYFLYYEEYDWCMRIRQAGFKVMYCGLSVVYHKESVSTGADSPFKLFYLNRNRILFATRNLGFLRAWLFTFYYAVVVMPVHGFKYLIKGEPAKAAAFVKALRWNLLGRRQA